MPWQDRIKEAAYTPQGGARLTFEYEDVRETVDLRGTRYDFVDFQGTFVQGTGSSGEAFPLRIFITGTDYDLDADAFMDALRLPGVGLLEHPIHGARDVVPLGRIVRRDDLKTAGNQAVFEVTFWETIGTLFPTGQIDPGSEVLQAVDGYNAAAADEFAEAVDVDSAIEAVALENKTDNILDKVSGSLEAVARSTQDVSDQFDDILDSIDSSLGLLVADPLTLAFQMSVLIQAPGRAAALWADKLDAYRNLADNIFGQDIEIPANDSQPNNAFNIDAITGAGALTGAIVGAVNTTFQTRPQALEAAQDLLALSDDLNTWRELNFTSLGETDTGGAYQQWQNAAALAAGFLVQISFTLQQERVITLDRARTIIDLAAELYGEIDARLDFLIDSNNLTGDEIKELPIGRQIKYYV